MKGSFRLENARSIVRVVDQAEWDAYEGSDVSALLPPGDEQLIDSICDVPGDRAAALQRLQDTIRVTETLMFE